MKEVDIVSKIVNREGGAFVPSSKGTQPIDLSDYLLKSIWDKVFEVRTDSQGTEYIFGKLPMVTQYGITMYSGDGVVVPSLASGLPFDGRTIWYNPDTNQIEVIGGTGGGSGEGVSNFWDLSGIPSWITNSKPKYTYSEIEGTPDLTKYALVSQIPSLSGYATESWVNQQNYAIKATTLSGYGITDAYTKTNVDDLLKSYVTLGGTPQTITGEKNFTGGLKVNGSPIYYDTEKKYWKLEGDLLVTGGVTMYGSDSSFTPSTIMDALLYDDTTLGINSNGQLYVKGGTSGGGLDITALQNYLTQNSYLNVTSGDDRYLLLSGGTISGASGNYTPLIVETKSLPEVWLQFKDTVGNTYIGSDKGQPAVYIEGDHNCLLLHSGNYSNYALPLSGGTLSSNSRSPLTLKSGSAENHSLLLFNRGSDYWGSIGFNAANSLIFKDTNGANYAIWHSGNDGSGSGLDADLLDGKHADSFMNFNANTTYVVASMGNDNLSKLASGNGHIEFWDSAGGWFNGKWGKLIAVSGFEGSLSGNASSATKLQTSRTIWGQSFDGTGNVSGELVLGSSCITGFQGINILDAKSSWVILGEGTNAKSWTTYINGYNINFRCGSGGTSGLYIDSTDRVGIGTTSPTKKLHIYDSNINNNSILLLEKGGAYDVRFELANSIDALRVIQQASGNAFISLNGNHSFNLETSNTVRFTIDGSGNVGIGTTNPQQKLHVEGHIWANGDIAAMTKIHAFGNLIADGNVGIGTESPSAKLHIVNNTNTSTGLRLDGGWSGYGFLYNEINIFLNGEQYGGIGVNTVSSAYGSTAAAGTYITNAKSGEYMNFYNEGGTFLKSSLLVNGGITMYSDQRKKTILNHVELSLKDIADAPLIEHYYNSDESKTTHVGSIAQYWANINDWFCKLDSEGYYTMEIQNAALASAISIARELDRYETKTDKAIKKLKKRICELEEEVERLKAS